MSYADATLSQEHIQPRRIAATSFAIAIHVAVLMMLMMPASVPSTTKEEEEQQIFIPIEHVIPPKPIEVPHEKPKPQVAPAKQQVAVKDDPIIDTEPPTAMSTQAEDPPKDPPNTFTAVVEPASTFVQLGVLQGPAPTYPAMALRRGLEGTVMLRIHVDANGRPIEVSIEQSSGSRILDEAAMKQVKSRWLFVAAQKDGQATDAWGLLPVQFALH